MTWNRNIILQDIRITNARDFITSAHKVLIVNKNQDTRHVNIKDTRHVNIKDTRHVNIKHMLI